MTGFTLENLGLLLLLASLVAMISRRLKLPYSVGLVAAGAALALLPAAPAVPLTRELIFNIFLPPLIFEAALQLRWSRFRAELPVTLTLAFIGVPIAAATVALGLHYLLEWSWLGSALFGALIAATDPVSVIAAFKEQKVQPRLAMVVESESLLNDGAAAVGFAILVAIAAGAASGPGAVATALVWTVAGGLGAGVLVAGGVLLLAGRTEDHLVEMTLTAIAAYGSFMLAEQFHASGVLAALAAGLMVGNVGWMGSISDEGRPNLLSFWEFLAFLANSLIFILIGLNQMNQPIDQLGIEAAVAIGLVLLGRALAVYPLAAAFAPTSLALPPAYQHILFWGGLRGALALALALAVPATIAEHDQIIALAFAVVAFSVFAQGLTMPLLLRRWRLMQGDRDPVTPPR
jgi:CPA1 family monovalent cation:H+ antiporter